MPDEVTEERESRGRLVSDPEIQAMAKLVSILEDVPEEGRSRVLSYLQRRFPTPVRWTSAVTPGVQP